MLTNIPKLIGNAHTLFIAKAKEAFATVKHKGQKIEIIYIAVCQYDATKGYYLFGCDGDFNTFTDYYYDDLDDALDDAKCIYNLKTIEWHQAK